MMRTSRERKIVFFLDGWFMCKRIQTLKSFYYDGQGIRNYCCQHLSPGDSIYRIFYYDAEPLDSKGHHPMTGKAVDFKKHPVYAQQIRVLDSIRRTPNMALRLGRSAWVNKNWLISPDKTKDLLKRKIGVEHLTDADVKPHVAQKKVDMKIGLDIATIALKRLADVMIIITGDSDIVPALKFARTEGMQVGLDPLWKPVSPDLSEHVDFIATRVPRPSSGKSGAGGSAIPLPPSAP